MLDAALLVDTNGKPLLNGKVTSSRDWNVVNAFARTPIRACPQNR